MDFASITMCHRLIRWISALVEKNVKSVDVEERVSIGKEHGRLVDVRVSVCVQLGDQKLCKVYSPCHSCECVSSVVYTG